MNTKTARTPPPTHVTYLFDGGNPPEIFFAKQRVYTIVSILEPNRGAFPARLLAKTPPANHNEGQPAGLNLSRR